MTKIGFLVKISKRDVGYSESISIFASEGEIVNGFAPFCLLKPSSVDHPSIGVVFLFVSIIA